LLHCLCRRCRCRREHHRSLGREGSNSSSSSSSIVFVVVVVVVVSSTGPLGERAATAAAAAAAVAAVVVAAGAAEATAAAAAVDVPQHFRYICVFVARSMASAASKKLKRSSQVQGQRQFGPALTVVEGAGPICCDVCSITFKTRQGLAGHLSSKAHLRHCKSDDIAPVSTSGIKGLLLAAASSSSSSSSSVVDVWMHAPSTISHRVFLEASRPVDVVARKSKHKKLGGSASRDHKTLQFKTDVIQYVDDLKGTGARGFYEKAALHFRVPVGSIGRWVRDKASIIDAAATLSSAKLLGVKARRLTKGLKHRKLNVGTGLSDLEARLKVAVKARLAARRTVSITWVHRVAKSNAQILQDDLGISLMLYGSPFKLSRSWVYQWLIRSGFVSRCRGHRRPRSVETLVLGLAKFVHFLRARVIGPQISDLKEMVHAPAESVARVRRSSGQGHVRTPWNPVYLGGFGKWGPNRRLNVDQVPCELDLQSRRSFVSPDGPASVSAPAGSDKRFCTLQMCFHPCPATPLPRLSIFFRGATESRILPREQAGYHPRVDIQFQPNAWADTTLCTRWANDTLAKWVKATIPDDRGFLLLCDSFSAQRSHAFIEAIHELGGEVCFGPPNQTEAWQPVDSGHLGATIKDIRIGTYLTNTPL
jgi:hypothetical protein